MLWYPDSGLFLCHSCKCLQEHEGSGKDTQLVRNQFPLPRAGLSGGEGPWQRGERTSLLYVWMTSVLTAWVTWQSYLGSKAGISSPWEQAYLTAVITAQEKL